MSIESEEHISLNAAQDHLEEVTGRRPHIGTVTRWCKQGLHGVKLEHVCYGRSLATSREALKRFSARLAGHQPEQPATPSSAPNKQKAAMEYLRECGVLAVTKTSTSGDRL